MVSAGWPALRGSDAAGDGVLRGLTGLNIHGGNALALLAVGQELSQGYGPQCLPIASLWGSPRMRGGF